MLEPKSGIKLFTLSKISFTFLKIQYLLRKKQGINIRELLMRLLSNYMRVFTQSCKIDDDKNDIGYSLVINIIRETCQN